MLKNLHRQTFLGIHSEAIGHFIRETEILDFLIQTSLELSDNKQVVLCTQKTVSNLFFLRVISETYKILSWPYGTYLIRALNRISRTHKARHDLFARRDSDFIFEIHKERSRLITVGQQEEMNKHLETHAQNLNTDEYVVFAIRDSGYDLSQWKNLDSSEQEYRHTPIDYFLPAIEFLESRNISVVRVGRHNNTSISSSNGKRIEISDLKCSNEALCDFAFFNKAKRVYSTGTGVDDIGLFLRKSTVYLNVAPFGNVPKSPLIKAMLASDYFDETGRRISLKELVDRNLHNTRPTKYIKSGEISIEPKSPKLILEFVSAIEGAGEDQSGFDIVKSLAKSGLGEQWENVLY